MDDNIKTVEAYRKSMHVNTLNKFWANVDRKEMDFTQCWNWIGPIIKTSGYGYYRINNKDITAHRAAYIITRGIEPDGHIRHLCNNMACVNPLHLYLVKKPANKSTVLPSKTITQIHQLHSYNLKINKIAEILCISSNCVSKHIKNV